MIDLDNLDLPKKLNFESALMFMDDPIFLPKEVGKIDLKDKYLAFFLVKNFGNGSFNFDKIHTAVKEPNLGIISIFPKSVLNEKDKKNRIGIFLLVMEIDAYEKKMVVGGLHRCRLVKISQKNLGGHPVFKGEVETVDSFDVVFRKLIEEYSGGVLLKVCRHAFELAKKNQPSFSVEIGLDGRIGEMAEDIARSVSDIPNDVKKKILYALDPCERFGVALNYLIFKFSKQDKDLSTDKKFEEKDRVSLLTERYEKIKKKIKPDTGRKIREELSRLQNAKSENSNFEISFNYVSFALDVFSLKSSKSENNIKTVKRVLNQEHCGLGGIKERILEYIAVKRLNPKTKSPILCFVGPPGTGKTSLGQSIAKSLKREFCRWSVGGVKDESEIRGHRRTYIGALPGRILDQIKNTGTNNPLFMLDEIDKSGGAFGSSNGEIVSALLEVLDPEQNHAFSDNYLQAGYDLSGVFFITTANTIETIPQPLLDRMEVLRLPGYTEEEKIEIAKKFLIPRQIKRIGLKGKLDVNFGDDAVSSIVQKYTREAGVRNLERAIEKVCRKLATKVVAKSCFKKCLINSLNLCEFLGDPVCFLENARELNKGESVGLAWTPFGGEIIFVESAIVSSEGNGDLILTGSLGEVMEESVQIALSYLRSRVSGDSVLKLKNDIHLHVPSGAMPKDGPSAGLAILFSFYSCFKGKVMRKGVAVTGEITLTGKVLPVGGIREKVIGAARAGVREIILPKSNERDLKKLPKSLDGKLKFHLVEHAEEALDNAFERKTKK